MLYLILSILKFNIRKDGYSQTLLLFHIGFSFNPCPFKFYLTIQDLHRFPLTKLQTLVFFFKKITIE